MNTSLSVYCNVSFPATPDDAVFDDKALQMLKSMVPAYQRYGDASNMGLLDKIRGRELLYR